MTSAQAALITNPLEGSIAFFLDFDSLALYDGSKWVLFDTTKPNATVIPNVTLYRNINGNISLKGNSTFQNIPVGATASDIESIDTDVFEVLSDGRIQVKKAGVYQISAGVSVRNFKAGDNKYILAVFKNGGRNGYLSRGYARIPSGDQYWGTSGVFQNYYNAGDIIEVQYYLSNPTNADLIGDFVNIGIIKL
ncbi:hypothetical protein [Nonlabens agnitus]|uniref:C1q domain-containing protein n=1 Tax=Nonlabens agnitus TaxID=870484 RepID=A0A2S9WUT7_9FLAO|nr:hypothetical protein [Nonlabens agnitus]PRP67223.1 hypothetical protein BST86_08980 [Nonlabens agnitus]